MIRYLSGLLPSFNRYGSQTGAPLCSDAPVVPISLQLKRKPLARASESLHPLPPIPL